MAKVLIKWMWRLFIAGIILFICLIIGINYGLLGYMPSMEELENPQSNEASTVYSADGVILGQYFYENRVPVKYEDISPNVIHALIATEDERYYEHSGIDGIAILRAIINFGNKGGGSTITQQLAKNLFPRENVSKFTLPFIKLKEWITAVKLERNLTKEEIITLYLNTVPFGNNSFGIKTAANTYYGKEPKDLTVDEAAVLIGMLKANTRYNPKRNPENSKGRRNVVIQKMYENNFITASDAEKYKSLPIKLNYQVIDHHSGYAPYFRQVLEIELKKWAEQHKKPDGSKYDIYKDGLKIYTTIDSKMQRYAEESVEEHLKSLQKIFVSQPNIKSGTVWNGKVRQNVLMKHVKDSDRYQILASEGLSHEEIMESFKKPIKMSVFTYANDDHLKDTVMSPLDSIKYMKSYLQAGFMVMDHGNGEVKAWVGGINHKYFQYDHVNMSTKRQVGSTIKPFVYTLAIDYGISPCSAVSTAPQKFPGFKLYGAGGSKSGSMSMSSALAASINNASLYLLNRVGIKNFINFIQKTGISSNIEAVPSIALGVSDISMYEMLWAYSIFPNQGVNSKPLMVTRITDRHGTVIDEFVSERKEVISSGTAFKMVKMMMGVIESGTARSLRSYGLNGDIAGKTGTTNNQADAWFIGFTPQYLAGAWVGCDDRFLRFNSGIGQGSKAALPIWGIFFRKMKNDKDSGYDPSKKFEFPKNFDYCSVSNNSQNRGIFTEDDLVPGKSDSLTNGTNKTNTNTDNTPPDLKQNGIIRDENDNIIEEIPTVPGTTHQEWEN